jgi:hypothetical protein
LRGASRLGWAAVERALPRRDLVRPVGRAALRRGRLRRHGGELRRRCRALRLLRVVRLLMSEVLRDGTAFGDHLIEPAIEPRQRVGDAIRCVRVCGWSTREQRSKHRLRMLRGRRRRRAVHDGRGRHRLRHVLWLRRVLLWRGLRRLRRRRGLPDASSRHALELPGQVIETVVYGREAIIDVLVLDTVAV